MAAGGSAATALEEEAAAAPLLLLPASRGVAGAEPLSRRLLECRRVGAEPFASRTRRTRSTRGSADDGASPSGCAGTKTQGKIGALGGEQRDHVTGLDRLRLVAR